MISTHEEKNNEQKKKKYSVEFKAKVALAALKGDKTLSELAQQFDMHLNQITQWKQQLLDNASELFSKGKNNSPATEPLSRICMRRLVSWR